MSLTPEQIADGWKPHNGGPCPVKPDVKVALILRMDAPSGLQTPILRAGRVDWIKRSAPNDIIAYKEHSNERQRKLP